MTKKALTEECRRILYNENVIEGADFHFMMHILSLHRESELKIGVGVKRIFRQDNLYGTKGFGLERLDGTTTDFSFVKAISHPSQKTEVKTACRHAIFTWKEGLRQQPYTVMHHHFVAFDDIVKEWLATQSGDNYKYDLTINPTKDNSQLTYFVNDETRMAFLNFHDRKATIVEVSVEEHNRIHSEKLMKTPIEELKGALRYDGIAETEALMHEETDPEIFRSDFTEADL